MTNAFGDGTIRHRIVFESTHPPCLLGFFFTLLPSNSALRGSSSSRQPNRVKPNQTKPIHCACLLPALSAVHYTTLHKTKQNNRNPNRKRGRNEPSTTTVLFGRGGMGRQAGLISSHGTQPRLPAWEKIVCSTETNDIVFHRLWVTKTPCGRFFSYRSRRLRRPPRAPKESNRRNLNFKRRERVTPAFGGFCWITGLGHAQVGCYDVTRMMVVLFYLARLRTRVRDAQVGYNAVPFTGGHSLLSCWIGPEFGMHT